jgi:hypothetical protein
LIGASVWIASPIVVVEPVSNWVWFSLPTVIVRCSALTMPAVTEPCRPSGLPIASTVSPTRTSSLLAHLANVRSVASTFSTARSVFASVPTTVADTCLPLLNETVTVRAPSTTWLLVTMLPSADTTTPEPSPAFVLTSTMAGCSAAAIEASDDRSTTGAALLPEVTAGTCNGDPSGCSA